MGLKAEAERRAAQVRLDLVEHALDLSLALLVPLHLGLQMEHTDGHESTARHMLELSDDEHLRVGLVVHHDLLAAHVVHLELGQAVEDCAAVRAHVVLHAQTRTLILGHEHTRVSAIESRINVYSFAGEFH